MNVTKLISFLVCTTFTCAYSQPLIAIADVTLSETDFTTQLGIPPKILNLSDNAYDDWVHVGLNRDTSAINRKDGANLLNEPTFNGTKSLPSGNVEIISDKYTISFTDGTPTASASCDGGFASSASYTQGVATNESFEIPVSGTGEESELKVYFETQQASFGIGGATSGVACKIEVLDESDNVLKTIGAIASNNSKDARRLSVRYSTAANFKVKFTRLGTSGYVILMAYTLSTSNEDNGDISNIVAHLPLTAFSASASVDGYSYEKAFDGNDVVWNGDSWTDNYWSSGGSTLDVGGPQWIQVDMGAKYKISALHMNWARTGVYGYYVQTSDNATDWATIFDASGDNKPTMGNRSERRYVDALGRYVRLTAVSLSLSPQRAGLCEFGVYVSPNLPELESDIADNKLNIQIVNFAELGSLPEIVTAIIAAYDSNGNYLASHIGTIRVAEITAEPGKTYGWGGFEYELNGVAGAAEYKGYIVDNIFNLRIIGGVD